MTWRCLCGEVLDDEIEAHEHPEGLSGRSISFMCCFCGKAADPAIQLIAVWGWSDVENLEDADEQYFFAHPSCFIDRLHPMARDFPWSD